MNKIQNINLQGLPREDLLMIADRACCILAQFSNMLTTDEGDPNKTEEEFGTEVSEVVEMAHDNFIIRSRNVLSRIVKDFPSTGNAFAST